MELTLEQFEALKPGDPVFVRGPSFRESKLATHDEFIMRFEFVSRRPGAIFDEDSMTIRQSAGSRAQTWPRLAVYPTYESAALFAISVLDYQSEEIAKLRAEILGRLEGEPS